MCCHPLKLEGVDELLRRVYLLVGAVVPAEVAEVVEHRHGEEALLAELVDGRGAVTLRELRAVLPKSTSPRYVGEERIFSVFFSVFKEWASV